MTSNPTTLRAIGIEHIRLAYVYTDAGDLDGYGSLLAPGAEIDVPELANTATRHEPLHFLCDGANVIVLGQVLAAPDWHAVDFADEFVLSPDALIQRRRRCHYPVSNATTKRNGTPVMTVTTNAATTGLDQIIGLVEEVIGTSGLTADSNFFDAGGDSLTAAHLSLLLEERLGIAVDVFTIYAVENLSEIHEALLGTDGYLA